MTDDQIRTALEALGQALSEGDAAAVAARWDVPALVLHDHGAIPVASRDEVQAFFAQAIAAYRQQGQLSTRPVIQQIAHLSPGLAAVDVDWPSFDAAGVEQGAERSHYVMRLGDDGQARIQVALTRAP